LNRYAGRALPVDQARLLAYQCSTGFEALLAPVVTPESRATVRILDTVVDT
jgi:hypothetical protein